MATRRGDFVPCRDANNQLNSMPRNEARTCMQDREKLIWIHCKNCVLCAFYLSSRFLSSFSEHAVDAVCRNSNGYGSGGEYKGKHSSDVSHYCL